MTDQKNDDNAPAKNEDQELWAYVTKDVMPLNNKHGAKRENQQDAKPEKIKKSPSKYPQKDTHIRRIQDDNAPLSYELDTRTAQKLQRGQFPIEMRLDLHGMSKNQAYDTLQAAIPKAHSTGKRCILVITGKGKPRSGNIPLYDQGYGLLKTLTPQWLSEAPLSQYVLRYEIAKPKDGGSGALYVLLKRQRQRN